MPMILLYQVSDRTTKPLSICRCVIMCTHVILQVQMCETELGVPLKYSDVVPQAIETASFTV